MKTMSDYIVYCTEEQTKRALFLGAPIELASFLGMEHQVQAYNINSVTGESIYNIPTTQQMIGWLRDEHNLFCGVDIDTNQRDYSITNNCSYIFYKFNSCGVFQDTVRHSMNVYTHREAELAAIDAALDYLEKGE